MWGNVNYSKLFTIHLTVQYFEMHQLAPVIMHTGSDHTITNGKFTLSSHYGEGGIRPLLLCLNGS